MALPGPAAFAIAFVGVPATLLAGLLLADLAVGLWRKFKP